MPAKSEKQRRFMAAVANNPKFAKKADVPQSVGEEFMKKSKGYMGGGMMKRYASGGELDMFEKDAKGDIIIGGVGGAPGDEITRGIPMDYDDTPRPKPKPKPPAKKKKPVKKMGGGKIEGYKKGGKVRGCGMAKQGVRPAKMVTMKGA